MEKLYKRDNGVYWLFNCISLDIFSIFHYMMGSMGLWDNAIMQQRRNYSLYKDLTLVRFVDFEIVILQMLILKWISLSIKI